MHKLPQKHYDSSLLYMYCHLSNKKKVKTKKTVFTVIVIHNIHINTDKYSDYIVLFLVKMPVNGICWVGSAPYQL